MLIIVRVSTKSAIRDGVITKFLSREFSTGDKVLLYNCILTLFPGKLKSSGLVHFLSLILTSLVPLR